VSGFELLESSEDMTSESYFLHRWLVCTGPRDAGQGGAGSATGNAADLPVQVRPPVGGGGRVQLGRQGDRDVLVSG